MHRVGQKWITEQNHSKKTIVWHGTKPFFRSDTFFDLQFKNTSNLILLDFKTSSKRFLFKNFKTGLTFWHMWFFNFQNLVRTRNHIGGTPCITGNSLKTAVTARQLPDYSIWWLHVSSSNSLKTTLYTFNWKDETMSSFPQPPKIITKPIVKVFLKI